MKKFILTVFISSLLLVSCEYRSTDDLVEVIPETQTVDYTTYIKPIINGNCFSCHGDPPTASAPMSLTSYDFVREAVENGGLIERISLPEGHELLMPQGGPRLPQATIDLFTAWQDDGFIE